MEDLNSIYFFIVMLSIAIVILAVRYTITLRKYLKEFIYVSKKVSNNEYHARLNISAKGELGELARNFNHMIKNMDKTLEEVQYKHLQLRSILKSISHGILAIDVNGNILLINDEAKEMIKSEPNQLVEGHNINVVIKEEEILKQILQFIGSKDNETANITTKDDIVYKIKVDPVYLQNTNNVIIGSIVNIEDITKKVKLENMRSDFVANVSHELKTPLTSISGFVETLKSNENIDVNTRNRFLEIIESESDRLKRLIDDILLLSFVENKDTLLMENVVVYDVFKEVYEITQHSASEKNIEVLYKCDDKSISILSNKDNGIVQVVVLKDEEKIVIKVIDNGVGIPKEDVERIFERFYRVDKARSRDVGGTGLGLAITKHIVKSLNGCIKVKSELGIGSEFIVTILQKNFLK